LEIELGFSLQMYCICCQLPWLRCSLAGEYVAMLEEHFTLHSSYCKLMLAGKMNGKYRKEKHINDRRENRKEAYTRRWRWGQGRVLLSACLVQSKL
jgi:hypothetical protein